MQPEWELWLDANLSPAIARWMNEHTGFVVKSAYILSLENLTDSEVFDRAKVHGNVILISKDSDFQELINRRGSPPKMIHIKIGNCDNQSLWNFIKPSINEAINILISSDIDIVELDKN